MDVEVRENAASVVVSSGDRVVIRIPENASTGYQWSIEELTAPLKLESSDPVTSSEPAPGAAGERVLKLRASERGEGRVVLVLSRPWERDTPPEDRFHIAVTVV
jgi:inhibitor of cysteine peptidase